MNALQMITAKKQAKPHSKAELKAFIMDYVHSKVPDYQVAAWLMAVCWQGMTAQETADLTQVMAESGDQLNLTYPQAVDKHSTGGVGDKTSLVLAPLLAVCGATVAKMSGRGLGHTGGTVDKLESIPGFNSGLSEAAFLQQAQEVGVVISGQSKDLAPADGMLYALRDVTATVESLPLIASSIMSKKLAGGAKAIVLDVKVGSGAFMKTLAEARALAKTMIDIGERSGRKMSAILSNMQEPLGFAIGNALEVKEAIACLQGEGPSDLRELCLQLAQLLLTSVGLNGDQDFIAAQLDNGRAYERFEQWVSAQGGDVTALDRLELAPGRQLVQAKTPGYFRRCDALNLGEAVKALGGGRSKKGEAIDTGVGVVLHAKLGQELQEGQDLLTIYHRGERGLAEANSLIQEAIQVEDFLEPEALILETL